MHLTPVAVVSGSMEPSISTHSLVFVEQVDPTTVRTGDVITFDPPGAAQRTTHRVTRVLERPDGPYFVTKGDANPVEDDWRRGFARPESWKRGVTFGTRDALRVRFHVPILGRTHLLSADARARGFLVMLPFLLLALLTVRAIWRPWMDARHEAAHDEHDTWTTDVPAPVDEERRVA